MGDTGYIYNRLTSRWNLGLWKIVKKISIYGSVGIDSDFLYRYHSDNLGCISIDIKIYQNTLKDV